MPVREFSVFSFPFSVKKDRIISELPGETGTLTGENGKGRRPTLRLWALFLALAIFGLGAASGAAENGLKARLVNKKPLGEGGPVSFYLGQVEILLPDGTKKLLPHWSCLEPQVLGDRVLFLPTEGLKLTRIFFYNAKTDKTDSYRLPLDMDPVFGSPGFSPDGGMLAYYLPKEEKVIVRSWPVLKLLKESERHPVRPTDVPPMPPVWTSPTRVEFDPLFFLPERQISFDLAQ